MCSVALVTVRGVLEAELEKDGNSFYELPDVFDNNHREFAVHDQVLVDHSVPPARNNEKHHSAIVEDIHRYCGRLMEFVGKPQEEIEVWKQPLGILHRRKSENRKR